MTPSSVMRLPAIRFKRENTASIHVLEKLGFQATGIVAPRYSCAREDEGMARMLRLTLSDGFEAEEPLAA